MSESTRSAFTLADLKKAMLTAVGGDDSIDLDGDILDVPMGDLGFDSLALMNVADVLEREHGVVLPDDGLEEMLATPRKALSCVEKALTGAAA